MTSYLERRWYLTTEGTSVTDTRRASGVVISAEGQADDGQLVHNYFLRYGHTAKDLPTDDELKVESKHLAESVAAMAKAPVLDHYIGPVLFEGEGAVGFIRATPHRTWAAHRYPKASTHKMPSSSVARSPTASASR